MVTYCIPFGFFSMCDCMWNISGKEYTIFGLYWFQLFVCVLCCSVLYFLCCGWWKPGWCCIEVNRAFFKIETKKNWIMDYGFKSYFKKFNFYYLKFLLIKPRFVLGVEVKIDFKLIECSPSEAAIIFLFCVYALRALLTGSICMWVGTRNWIKIQFSNRSM